MGGKSSSTSNTTQHTTPYGPAQGTIDSLLAGVGKIGTDLTRTQSSAISGLEDLANRGNPYASSIGKFASTALNAPDYTGTVNDAYKRYVDMLNPTASGDYLDPNKNPWFSAVMSTIGNDVENRLKGLYAGSGRDPAGAGNYGYNLGKGIAEATAPVFSDAYNRERTNQMNAAAALYGAGNTTANTNAGLDTSRFANMSTGVNASNAAIGAEADPYNRLLAAEAQKSGIPLSLLQQVASIAGPLGQQFGTTNSNTTGTQEMSGAQQFATILQGLGALFGGKKSGTGQDVGYVMG